MAIRYSADVEIRVTWNPKTRAYDGTVRGLALVKQTRGGGTWEVRRWSGSVRGAPPGRDLSAAYDEAARRLLGEAEGWARSKGWSFESDRSGTRIVVDRIFKAPCPVAAARDERGRGITGSRGHGSRPRNRRRR